MIEMIYLSIGLLGGFALGVISAYKPQKKESVNNESEK